MRMDKLTTRFQQALADAQSLAVGRDHPAIEPVHVMAALLEQPQGSTTPLLAQSGVALPAFRKGLSEALDALPKLGNADGNVQVSPALARSLNLADKAAQQRKDQFIASELFVLAATQDAGTLGQLLKQHGATPDGITRAIDAVRGGQAPTRPMPKSSDRRCRNTPSTSPSAPRAASSIR